MHPVFWKTLSALFLLCILIQLFGGDDWSPRIHAKHFAQIHHQGPQKLDHAPGHLSELGDWQYQWERDRNNHALSADQCDAAFPELFSDIDRATLHWQDRKITPESIELYNDNEAGVRVLFKDQRLRIVQTKGMFRADFRQRITAILHQLDRAITSVEAVDQPFENTEFTVIVDDWPNFPRGGRELALWSFTRALENVGHAGVWLVPDFNFWSAPPASGAFQEMQAKARKHDAPISEKEQKLVWRGVDWTNPEVREALLNTTAHKAWADVKKVDWSDDTNILALDELCRYAYLVNTEGRSWSSRLLHLYNCDSVPVSHDLAWMAHYYHLLEPNVNYIPVNRNFSDLGEKLEYYIDHPDVAQVIADNAKAKFRERYTTPAATACYWRRLLRAWSNIAFQPQGYEWVEHDKAHREKRIRGITFEEFL